MRQDPAIPPAGRNASASAHADGTPVLDDTIATGTELVERFTRLIAAKDVEALDDLIVENYVIQRSIGPAVDKAEYLEALLDITSWEVFDALVVRWSILIELEFANSTRLRPDPTNYLTTFTYLDGDRRVAAHANFAPVLNDNGPVASSLD